MKTVLEVCLRQLSLICRVEKMLPFSGPGHTDSVQERAPPDHTPPLNGNIFSTRQIRLTWRRHTSTTVFIFHFCYVPVFLAVILMAPHSYYPDHPRDAITRVLLPETTVNIC